MFRFQNRYIKMATTATASTNERKVENKFYLCIWFNVAEKVLRAEKQMAFLTIFALNYIFFEIFFVDFSFGFCCWFFPLSCNSSVWLKKKEQKASGSIIINRIGCSGAIMNLWKGEEKKNRHPNTRGQMNWSNGFQIVSIHTFSITLHERRLVRSIVVVPDDILLTVGKWPLLSILLKIYAIN